MTAPRTLWSNPAPHPVSAVAFSPAGDRVAAGTAFKIADGPVGSLTVYDARTGAVQPSQTADDWPVSSLAFSPDGRWLATAERRSHPAQESAEGRARVVDAESGTERCRYAGRLIPAGVMFGPDGTWIAAHGQSSAGIIGQRIWVFDAVTGSQRWARGLVDGLVLACSPDGTSVAVGYRDGLAVLDARTGANRVGAASAPASAAAYTPDGRAIAVGCADGAIRLLDAASGAPAWSVRLGTGDAPSVRSVAVSDDGRWVAALAGWAVGVYDIASGTPRYAPVAVVGGTQLIYSPTLRHIAVNGRLMQPPPSGPLPVPYPVTVIDARTGRGGEADQQQVMQLAAAPDGRSLLAGEESGESGFVTMYDLGVEVSRYPAAARLTSVAMSSAGTPLVAVAGADQAVTVIDADTGTYRGDWPIPGTIAAAIFADSGQAVAAGGSDGLRFHAIVGNRRWTLDGIGTVYALAAVGPAGEWIAVAADRALSVVASADGHARWPNPVLHPQRVTRVTASRDGTWIATGCADRTTRLINAATAAQAFSFPRGDGRVAALAFQPAGPLLATGNEDGTVILADTVTGSLRMPLTHQGGCTHIAFGFDAATLAVAWKDNTVHVFDITAPRAAPRKLRELGYPTPVSALAFNPADNSLAVATGGRTVTVLDARAGVELARILHPAAAPSFAFSGDGALIATISDDAIVRVWTSGSPPREEQP
jgi:WD40 repeat protein